MLNAKFVPREIEARWYPIWESRGYFKAGFDESKPSFSIHLPPPNITGTLHMGHAYQHTLMDILVRYHRMKGFNVLWQPGTDHAGIATQVVVERQLEQSGESRNILGREEFLRRVWSWKNKSGSTITRQMRRLGASCDWTREYFTMDEMRSRAVTEIFVRLFDEGLIYRGKRLVNWDPIHQTALSDLEVESHEVNGFLWHLRYPIKEVGGYLVVATTRPETMLGDSAIAVNPKDPRYSALIGLHVHLPLTNRIIPIIADEYVDSEFGTGAVKITPAHDFNDYQVGMRHALPMLSIFTHDARLNENTPTPYQGLDRFEAREKILADLDAAQLIECAIPHKLMQPRSQRSQAIVEPMLSDQWFLCMDKMAKNGLQAVADGNIEFIPMEWVKTYNQWLENIQDWCISRQIWWGHQIPAWYAKDGSSFVGRDFSEARMRAKKAGQDICETDRDPDVLDTWFSSALVPFAALGWPDQVTFDLERRFYLPSTVLVTAFDIVFFWVARMIMATQHILGEVPFKFVYFNAIVRDAEGNKMSKSKGNTIDPLDIIDGIELPDLLNKSSQGLLLESHRTLIVERLKREYPEGIPSCGADALRFTYAALSTLGRTVNFDIKRAEGYRGFCNKLWNAARFVLLNCKTSNSMSQPAPQALSTADRWILSRLQRTIAAVHTSLAQYRFDSMARVIYEHIWDEYCDWYVEMAKVQLNSRNELELRATQFTLVSVLETILRLAHPIVPFITEELWQNVAPLANRASESIVIAPYPLPQEEMIDDQIESEFVLLKEVINTIRKLRATIGISPSVKMSAYVIESDGFVSNNLNVVSQLCRISSLHFVETFPKKDFPIAATSTVQIMLDTEIGIDREAMRTKLAKEVEQVESEMAKAHARLQSESFIERAPATIVELERTRLAALDVKYKELKVRLQNYA